MVDEVTGRMYVLRGDALERIPEVASHRRRDELSPSVTPRVPAGRDKGAHPERSYEEQPPTGTLIPPARPAWEEPRGTPGKKGMKGPSLPKKNGSSPGVFLSERSQAEARQSAVEAVRRNHKFLLLPGVFQQVGEGRYGWR